MQIGFLPPTKDVDGEWLFTVTEVYTDGHKRIVYDYDLADAFGDRRGMKEPVFRELLADKYKMLPAHIDETVKNQIGGRK